MRLGVSSLLSILIPPSVMIILFAVVTRQSVAACVTATIGPAMLLIADPFSTTGFSSEARSMKSGGSELTRKPWSRHAESYVSAFVASYHFGGIHGGIFTPTKAAAVSTVAALILGGLIYREFT